MDLLNTWQFNLIAFLLCLVLFYQFYKLAVKHSVEDGAATILLQVIGGISIIILIPLFPIILPADPKFWFFIILACVFYAISDRLQTTARKNMEVSVFSIVNQVSTIFLIMYGALIFRESLGLIKLLGAIAILGGNMVLFYKAGKFAINKYIVITVLAALSFTTALTIDISISRQINLPIYIMFTLLVPAIMLFIAERLSVKKIANEFRSGGKKYYLITGVIWGLLVLFSLRSFQFGEVTKIVPLQATGVLLNVIVAFIFLKERDSLLKKLFAATLVILGIYLTVI